MNVLKYHAIALVVGGLMFAPAMVPSARADDDWEDRWEDYREALEERREEERERWEEWREDREEAFEDWEEDRVIVRPRHRGRLGYYYEEELPPPRYYHRDDRYYGRPVYRDRYRDERPVYEYYSRPRYRYYGTPGVGYSEQGRERSVRVGPVQVYWTR